MMSEETALTGQNCIMITGGAGFIGCKLSSLLLSFGLPIVAVDNLHPQVHPGQTRPELMPDYVNLFVMDICDGESWRQVLSKWKPRILVHLAAETGTGQSLTESSRHAMVNVVGTTRMLDALLEASYRPDHVLLSSSRAVYGEGAWKDPDGEVCYPGIRGVEALEAGRWNFTNQDAREMSPLPHRAGSTVPKPTSVYGATKLAQEQILGAWCSAIGVPLSILRFQNVYGPGQSPFNAYTGIINRMPPPKAVCPDLINGFKCMPYVMRYSHFTN
ncbi:SDR family oxidoreductase [Ciceribacter thiooxidans]|nr:SDR family oxidoreductase [Ciceribacter thiooxidans]